MKKLQLIPELSLQSNYVLPTLPYSYNAIEPYIDARTMEIHHTKHHQAYIDNLNNALKEHSAKEQPLLNIFREISKFPMAVRNNGGGHFNHQLFWSILKPTKDTNNMLQGDLKQAIEQNLNGFDAFVSDFSQAAMTRFGSGWAWLAVDEHGKLFVTSTPNQDNPLMDIADKQGYPILGLDVWEHAYYLQYQNRRAEYVKAFFNIINWNEVSKRFQAIVNS